ncbi:MAG: DUF2330 domain-containing protein [Polyangiales bacterium]
MRGLALALAFGCTAVLMGAPNADAFCGFYVAPGDKPLYNDATMVALMREGTRTVITMSNNYKGPAASFAMVVPVPVVLQKDDVKTLNKAVFTHLEELTAPRLVEYWEQDPCPPPVMFGDDRLSGGGLFPGGGGGPSMAPTASPKRDYGVTIEAKFEVGEYDILVLGAKESDGLEAWLTDNKYNIPKGASSALAPYIKEGMKFFVAKIDITKVKLDKQGVAQLSPLRFQYETPDFRLPVRLGLLNAHGKQDLIVFTLSKGTRYDVANYPNVFIPTNLEVKDETRKSFGPFYAALFDEAVKAGSGKAIVTEYSWQATSCDPCPTPPLSMTDVATLGGDVLFGMASAAPPPAAVGPGGSPMSRRPGGGMSGGFYGIASGMVLTRLHARYDSTTLTDDLVFRAAPSVVGGRELYTGVKASLEQGASPASMNNFQARYIIRHPWTGPMTCQFPQRGVWGGPPSGEQPKAVAATGLASAARGGVKLETLLKSPMPLVAIIEPSPVLPVPSAVAPSASASASVAPIASIAPPASASALPVSSATPADSASASPATVPSVSPSQNHGCGCATPGVGSTEVSLIGGSGAALLLVGLRRRRRS